MSDQNLNRPALVLKMEKLMPTLSKSEKSVAQYIIQRPEEVIYLSIASLAKKSGVSDPTVVRTCQKLGFRGYQSLKVTLAQDIANPLKSASEQLSADDDMQKTLSKVFRGTINTLEFTHDTLNSSNIEAAAKALMEAKAVLIYGLGGSSSIAVDFRHKLLQLGMNAIVYTDPHLQAIASAYAGKGTLVFAVSHSGSSKSVVDNVKAAKANGAFVISLTDMGTSPLSKLADISIFTASGETQYPISSIASRIAELTITDAIYTYIAMHSDKEKILKANKAVEELKY